MMVSVTNHVVDLIDQLSQEVEALIASLGQGLTFSIPYDTGWIARLHRQSPQPEFENAYTWILKHQHSDGSWGSPIEHYHDRTICTLSAIIALKQYPSTPDIVRRLNGAIDYVNRHIDHIHRDPNDTVNYRGLAALLFNEAQRQGVDIHTPSHYRNDNNGSKLARLQARPDLWPGHSITYSLECFLPNLDTAATAFEPTGSIAGSPSATAAVLLNSTGTFSPALDYLRRTVQPDGGVPVAVPIDLFETAWATNILRNAKLVTADHPHIRRILNWLWQHWDPARGASFSSLNNAPDLDITATSFLVLHWAGYSPNPTVFTAFEEVDRFVCYPDESDPSLSVQVRLLAALKAYGYPPDHPWVQKITAFLTHYEHSTPWIDKWHTSPYYIYNASIPALTDIKPSLATQQLHYVLDHQRTDGGWGHYMTSTPEETAYALQILLWWHCNVSKIEMSRLSAAATYLTAHRNGPFPESWVSKCLYIPLQIVKASILATLYTYSTL